MKSYTEIRLMHSVSIEKAIDAIIEVILDDRNVECETPEDGTPVSAETWLAVKARVLNLLEEVFQHA
jgi:hypothetical protein